MPADRTRRFDLPGIQELNKDQDEALALPPEGQHLIVGGPGTGKSVVALLRARKLGQSEKKHLCLVYNRLLEQSNRHLFGSEQPLTSQTWDKWFRKLWRGHFRENVPTLEPQGNGEYRSINWDAVSATIRSRPLDAPLVPNPPFLVIDEGQDMPRAFYDTLTHLGFENFYVVADQNQQIHPDKCSSRQDIESALAIAVSDTLELKTNYRNTRPIALLAQHFYPADPASPRPDLPPEKPGATTPELRTYDTANAPSIAEIAAHVLQLSDRNPRKLIGIITPDNTVRKKFHDALVGTNPKLDNDKPPIRTFASDERAALDFRQGGLMVINAQSCKGLEFDIAILADIDQHQPKRDTYALKARFYVMVARARERVILLRTGNVCPVVEGLLPTDPTVLVR